MDKVIARHRRRPRWWRENADISLRHHSPEDESPPLITLVLEAAQILRPGQTLSLTLDFEPDPLYRLLDERGYEHWSEPTRGEELRIDIWRPEPSA